MDGIWWTLNLQKHKDLKRIVFHEIKPAIEAALEHPRSIDKHLVDAQQAAYFGPFGGLRTFAAFVEKN